MGNIFSKTALLAMGRSCLDALFPPGCPRCGEEVDRVGALCPDCWPSLDFISDPLCHICGIPFEYSQGEAALCGACIAAPPPYAGLRSALHYNEASRAMVLSFKHGDRSDRAPTFAAWMKRAGRDLLEQSEMVAPVPLHPSRLIKRRYNQSALLASGIAKGTGLDLAQDLLVRTRATASQGNYSAKGRVRNVRGAFAVNTRWQPHIEGKTVLLVDDVLTTGATVEACTRSLLSQGVTAVNVLTLCRVVQPASLNI